MSNPRLLLLQASAVATLGGVALTRPASAAAHNGTFDSCSLCIADYTCNEPQDAAICWATCQATGPICGELGTCSGNKRLLWCSNKPAE